jgi:hypothetical protein
MLITEVIAPIASKLVPAIAQAAAKLTPATGRAAQTATSIAKPAVTAAPSVVNISKFKDSGLSFVNMPTKIFVNHKATSVLSPVVNYEGRAIVIVKVNGTPMPFYCSSGEVAKAGVTPGKWYPVFGIGPDGWINKGTSAGIAQYYNVPALRSVANRLDSSIGDIRGQLTDMSKIGTAKADAIAVINQGRSPVAHSAKYDDFKANAMAQLKPFL